MVCHTLCDALCDAAAAQELAILRVWPFESVCVDVFNIENQPPHGEASILRPLQVRRGVAWRGVGWGGVARGGAAA